jgi:hypothetical protein
MLVRGKNQIVETENVLQMKKPELGLQLNGGESWVEVVAARSLAHSRSWTLRPPLPLRTPP